MVAAMGRCDEYHKANQVFWTDIPVAFSPLYNPDTQLNLNEPNGLPDPTLLTGKGNSLSEFVGLPFNIRPPSWTYTGQLKDTLWSHKKVDIIGTNGR